MSDPDSFSYTYPTSETTFVPICKQSLNRKSKTNEPIGVIVENIIRNCDKFYDINNFKFKTHTSTGTPICYPYNMSNDSDSRLKKNESFLWSQKTASAKQSLSTDSELSTPGPVSPDINTPVFFEYNLKNKKDEIKLWCINFILWERLSCQFTYPILSSHKYRKNSNSNKVSRNNRYILQLSPIRNNESVNMSSKDVKMPPLTHYLILLSQARPLLNPDGAWYFNYLDGVSVI